MKPSYWRRRGRSLKDLLKITILIPLPQVRMYNYLTSSLPLVKKYYSSYLIVEDVSSHNPVLNLSLCKIYNWEQKESQMKGGNLHVLYWVMFVRCVVVVKSVFLPTNIVHLFTISALALLDPFLSKIIVFLLALMYVMGLLSCHRLKSWHIKCTK